MATNPSKAKLWLYNLFAQNPVINYKDMCDAWKEQKVTGPMPNEGVFYATKRRARLRAAKAESNGDGNTLVAEEPVAIPASRRPKGSRPVARTFNGQQDKRFKLVDEAHDVYVDIENRLDDLVMTADRLNNKALTEALRHARRLASKELI